MTYRSANTNDEDPKIGQRGMRFPRGVVEFWGNTDSSHTGRGGEMILLINRRTRTSVSVRLQDDFLLVCVCVCKCFR